MLMNIVFEKEAKGMPLQEDKFDTIEKKMAKGSQYENVTCLKIVSLITKQVYNANSLTDNLFEKECKCNAF